jgi:hypothetical protein
LQVARDLPVSVVTQQLQWIATRRRTIRVRVGLRRWPRAKATAAYQRRREQLADSLQDVVFAQVLESSRIEG